MNKLINAFKKGEENLNAKLTEDDVKLILQLKGHLGPNETASKFEVAPSTIRRIWTRECWTHVNV